MTIRESGLYDQSVQTGAYILYELYANKQFDFRLEERQDVMVLDEMKIALGPYMCGTAMAVIVLILEIREVFV